MYEFEVQGYKATVHWSDEDEAFIGLIPAFPGLSTFGRTEVGAAAEAGFVLSLFWRVLQESGRELPPKDAGEAERKAASEAFRAHCKASAETVATWPEWKQRGLG